ncbi:MAG TPA: GatB/YqeY domain-containing protein [Myxococcota bacterium]|nr:GatB/YqeY domain-containing protein [Myxococcota bacterium]
MGLVERVSEQMKAAQKARDTAQLTALRNVRAALLLEMKKDGSATLDDAVATAVLRRLAKQREESIEAFANAGRADRADAERAEKVVIESFLPRLADEATTRAWVEAAMAETGATSARDLGRVMGAVMKAHRDDVDGALARKLASELLASA